MGYLCNTPHCIRGWLHRVPEECDPQQPETDPEFPDSPVSARTPRKMNDEQVDKWGRLFARIMDKRDGVGSQEAVDAAIADVFADFWPRTYPRQEES